MRRILETLSQKWPNYQSETRIKPITGWAQI
jgi:hypothetical protein